MGGIAASFQVGKVPDLGLVGDTVERWLAHRGPDGVGKEVLGGAVMAHTRLAVLDAARGHQPMRGEGAGTLLVCNGEIYNHRALRQELSSTHHFQSDSDSEVVLHLYEELGDQCVSRLDGMFAYVVSDGQRLAAARDPLGIKPLYVGRGRAGELWVASEFKALLEHCSDFCALPPGSLLTEQGEAKRWFVPRWEHTVGQQLMVSIADLPARLERAVVKRLMGDVPIGVFLSGGLDSSLIAALAQPHLRRTRSFAVGLAGSPDLEAARFAACALGIEHHECTYSLEDIDRNLETIIYHLESYDPELIRNAVPCYFLSELATRHVKVVLTGDGADELFAGYDYFREIQDPAAVHHECVRLLLGLHSANLQRLDRMTMAHGLEGRVPFLDAEFVNWVMGLAPELKLHRRGMQEKRLLRAAASALLPPHIASRPKLEFSQGSGAETLLASYAEQRVSDRDLTRARVLFPADTPRTKEELLYRLIFGEHFPSEAARRTVHRWRPPLGPLKEAGDCLKDTNRRPPI